MPASAPSIPPGTVGQMNNQKITPRIRLAERWNRLVTVNVPDEEDARLGRLFNILMIISTGIVICLSVIFLLMQPLGFIDRSVSLEATTFPAFFIPLSILCLMQSKRGHIRPSISLYVWVNFFAIGLAAWIFDGVYSPAWILYIWTITIAGTLLAPLYALLMTGGVVLYFFLLLLLYQTGIYTPLLTFGSAGGRFLDVASLLIMLVSTVGLLTYLNMRSLRETMSRLHRENFDRKLMERALKESEQKYRTVADFTYDWEYWIDPDEAYVYVSPSCERITGYPPEDFVANPDLLTTIVHPDDRERIVNHIHEVMAEDRDVRSIEFRIITRAGKERWIGHTCQSVSAIDGTWLGRRGTNRDITDRKMADDALRAGEAKYRKIFENVQDIFYQTDVDGTIIDISPSIERYSGYTREELIGTPVINVYVDPEDRKRLVRAIARKGEVVDYELQLKSKSDRVVYTSVNAHIFHDSNGTPAGIEGSLRDITERKRVEEALRESEERFRATAASAIDAIISADSQGRIIFWNKAAMAMFGYSEEEALGQPLDILLPETNRESYRQSLNRSSMVGLARLVGRNLETQARRKDGTYFAVEHSVATWNTPTGRFFTGIVRDITERKKAEKERESLIEELQESITNIKTLSGLLPICSSCKKIRDDKGYWNQVEKYLTDHTQATLTHGMCPECMQKYYPDYVKAKE